MSNLSNSTTAKPILDIQHVSKVFDLNGQSIHALKDVDLKIQKGEFICLIGASGCGKSTLLRIMGGFETVSTGSATMYGAEITEPDSQRGMVFQDYGLFPWLTVRQNIAFGPKQRGLSEAKLKELTDHYLEWWEGTKFPTHSPNNY